MTSLQIQDAILEAFQNFEMWSDIAWNNFFACGKDSEEYISAYNIMRRECLTVKTHLLHLKSLHPKMVIE